MATLTKEQFLKFNKNLLNGWRLDTYYYANWGEKTIIITVCENAGTRKNYKMLEALTKDFTIEKLEKMFEDVEVETCGGMIIE